MSTSASSAQEAAPTANNSKSRRISTSPTPPTLEQKFELLEARFTQPLGLFGNPSANNLNASLSPPPRRNNNSNINESSNLSEHSFSFSRESNSNHSNLQQPPTMNIRSKRNRSMTSLDIVSRAAAKHMRKVAASTHSPVTDTGALLPATGTSNFSFSSHSSNSRSPGIPGIDTGNSNSEQTLVAGNRTSRAETRPQAPQQPLQQEEQPLSQQSQPPTMERVVAESPPVLISPAKASSSTKPQVARALQINNPNHERQPPSSTGSASVGSVSFVSHQYDCPMLHWLKCIEPRLYSR